MNFSPEAVAGMSEEHRGAFLAQLEHMQIRDRCVACPGGAQSSGSSGSRRSTVRARAAASLLLITRVGKTQHRK
jgi:hypothetical protein